MISLETGFATAYSLFNFQARGIMFISPGTEIYEGMIIGENTRENDMGLNVIRGKKLSNMRASGSDDMIKLTPPREFSLEQAMEYIEDDELLEVTPSSIRMRKKLLKEIETS